MNSPAMYVQVNPANLDVFPTWHTVKGDSSVRYVTFMVLLLWLWQITTMPKLTWKTEKVQVTLVARVLKWWGKTNEGYGYNTEQTNPSEPQLLNLSLLQERMQIHWITWLYTLQCFDLYSSKHSLKRRAFDFYTLEDGWVCFQNFALKVVVRSPGRCG